jgi:hypothetical protein
MKTISIILFCATLLATSCKKDDDEPGNPADSLPLETQVGAQTFGCLVDGEVFLPKDFGQNRLQAFYQKVNDNFTLSISSESGEKATTSNFIVLGGENIQPLQEKTYPLISDSSGNFLALFSGGAANDTTISTTEQNPGKLIITKFDPENFILSGTFEFTVIGNNGREIKVTNGRFDVTYTN